MKKFLRCITAGAFFLLWAGGAAQAQEVIYVVGPTTGAQNLQGLGFSWADYNRDGTLDLFVEPGNLIRNNGGTSFTRIDPSGIPNQSLMVGSAFADFNGDGYPDLLATQGGVAPFLYQYDPNTGMYVDVTPSSGDLFTVTTGGGQMYGVAAGDYDRDGYLDIAFGTGANTAASGLRLLKGGPTGFTNVGTTSLTPVIDTLKKFEPWNPHFVDVNNDGYLDLFMPSIRNSFPASRCVLFLNNQNGTFSPPAHSLYTGPIDTGLVVGDTVRRYSAIASAWADFDNDGKMDVALSALGADGTGFRLLKGKGDGTFTDVSATCGITYNSNARGISWGDYNNDGFIDFFEGAGFATPKMWRNNGDGTFTNASALVGIPASGFNARSAQLIDYDGNGWLDFYSVAGGGDNVWKNTNGNLYHWIGIKTEGAGHNGMAIGARVSVVTNAGTKTQIRNIECGGSGGATGGSVWAHFGIGNASTVDAVIVDWPDGSRQTFTGLAPDKYWTIKQGSVVPATPTLATPANGASGQPGHLTLTWNAAAGALSYWLQVSLDQTFSDPSKMAVNAAAATNSFDVALGLASTYYWRVYAVNAGFKSPYSSVSSFSTVNTPATTVPALVSPTTNALDQPGLLTLICGRTPEAAQYRFQVSTLPSFSGFTANDLTVDTAHAVQLVAGRKYYWRVAGENGAGASAFTAPDSFTVMGAPGAPGLVYPANNAVNIRTDTLVLVWRAMAGATSYVLQLKNISSTVEYTTSDTTYQVTGLPRLTNYTWKVRGYNIGGTSVFSSTWSFTTIIAAPAAPSLLLPVASEVDVNRLAKLTWASSINATKYRVQIAHDVNFARVVQDFVVGFDTTVVLTTPLEGDSTYYWKVAGQNIGGEGAFSASRFFITSTLLAIGETPAGVPETYDLSQNYPNPFNPSTMIRYSVPKNAHVTLTVYDLLGRSVATLVDGVQAANRYSVEWNASGVSTGVYFYRMDAQSEDGSGNFTSVKKLILMK